jgi:hypothetical protein
VSDRLGVPGDSAAPLPRRAERERRLIRGVILRPSGAREEILVRNLSSGGLGATTRGCVPFPGEAVDIALPQGSVLTGTVRWVDGMAFGVAFSHMIDAQALIDSLINRQASGGQGAAWEVKSRHRVATYRPDPASLRRI